MRRFLGSVGVLAVILGLSAQSVTVSAQSTFVRAASGSLRAAQINIGGGTRAVPTISSGSAVAAGQVAGIDSAGFRADNAADAGPGNVGITPGSLGCRERNTDGNVRVNQDCTYRRQAEELIKVNPLNPNNLIAGQNDSRIGFNKCGFDYSLDAGRTWGDGQPPFYQHLNSPTAPHTVAGGPPSGHTYDAGSDPALAFDSQGRAFYSCVLFDINDNAAAVVVTSSPPGASGSFYNNVPAAGTKFIVAEDNNGAVAHDKQFITADQNPASTRRDNVYVTWTVFKFDPRCPAFAGNQCESPIYGSMSTDHAVTWSPPELISSTSDTLCFFGNQLDPLANPHACNFDQGSDPAVLPNGDLEVIFNNGNTPAGNPNSQTLGVHCNPSPNTVASLSAHLNCAKPTKVGDDISSGEPQCDFGRGPEECIPGPFIRTNDFPRIAVNKDNGHLFATWQDYRGQEFDIQISQSLDGGLTWTPAPKAVNPDRGKDHYMPAIDVVSSARSGEGDASIGAGARSDNNGSGDHVGVSYYLSDRVPSENVPPAGVHGFQPGMPGVKAEASDYVVSGGRGIQTPYDFVRVSPSFPPPDGNQAGFNGDYSGLILVGSTAHPIWSDTRNVAPAGQVIATATGHDEDIFTQAVALPDGRGDNN